MEINVEDVVTAKLKRLEEMRTSGNMPYLRPRFIAPLQADEVEQYYIKRITLVKEHGVRKMHEMLQRIDEMGYRVTQKKISPKGVMTLKAERGGIKCFGFCDPTGKLILSNQEKANVLTVNYTRRSMHVHDKFLEVILRKA